MSEFKILPLNIQSPLCSTEKTRNMFHPFDEDSELEIQPISETAKSAKARKENYDRKRYFFETILGASWRPLRFNLFASSSRLRL